MTTRTRRKRELVNEKIVRPCRNCGHITEMISGYCEECYLKARKPLRVLKRQYRERPRCRKVILRSLKDNPNLPLFKIAFWYEYRDTSRMSDGLMIQARKMIQEAEKNEVIKCKQHSQKS